MIEVLKQALEALECLFGIPEQFTGKGGGDVAVWTLGGSYRAQQAIPALRQAIAELESQEPVIDKSAATRIATSLGWSPQRTWVGLTDEEIWDAYMKAPVDIDCHVSDLHKFARAIEAKLKERNS